MRLKYSMVIEPTEDPSFHSVYFLDLPGCTASGKSVEEAVKNGFEAQEEHLKLLEELGKPIPKGFK